jgi:uncharacterized RmlC-like cupin family protein
MTRDAVTVVRADQRSAPEVATRGMERTEAYAADGVWIGTVRTEPGVATGWHHHGLYESWVYVVAGRARMEFGPGGRDVEICHPGDLIHVPPGVVHREITEGDRPAEAILFPLGTGEVTVNTDGPAPDDVR